MTHPLLTSKYAHDLALKINNPATPAIERAVACVELAQFAELANIIHERNQAHKSAVKRMCNSFEQQYVWRNGARVRVKS